MTTYEEMIKHLGKTIVSVYEKDKHIMIQFTDNTHMVLVDQGCNTCGGYKIKGAE